MEDLSPNKKETLDYRDSFEWKRIEFARRDTRLILQKEHARSQKMPGQILDGIEHMIATLQQHATAFEKESDNLDIYAIDLRALNARYGRILTDLMLAEKNQYETWSNEYPDFAPEIGSWLHTALASDNGATPFTPNNPQFTA